MFVLSCQRAIRYCTRIPILNTIVWDMGPTDSHSSNGPIKLSHQDYSTPLLGSVSSVLHGPHKNTHKTRTNYILITHLFQTNELHKVKMEMDVIVVE
jgi:hypothetical protein